MLSRVGYLLTALAAFSVGCYLAWHYPLGQFVALLLFISASALAYLRTVWFLVIIPASLPIIGLAPWTGWITFEEVDLLVMAMASGGYARAWLDCAQKKSQRHSLLLFGLSTLMSLSILISMSRGFSDAGGFVFGWYQGYDGPMNSIRIGKSFFLALLLMPLINRLRRNPENQADHMLAWGLALGLGTASLAALWERLAFTDLLNFSSDYRSTAMFWEMHVGGAALDGWLLLTVPFAIWALRHARTRFQHALSLCLIVLAAYAALTTFSRGVYLALLVALPLLAWQTRMHTGAKAGAMGQPAWSPLRWFIALILLATMAGLVFSGGGYRGLMALLGVIAVALAIPQVLRSIGFSLLLTGALLGLVIGGLLVLVAGFLPKGPYVLHFVLFGVMLLFLHGPQAMIRRRHPVFAAAGFFALAVTAANVADHWGGMDARWGMSAALAVVIVVTMGAVFVPRPVWPEGLRWQGVFMSTSFAVCAVISVFIGGGYMGDRFSTSSKDLDGRFDHWNVSLSMLQTPIDHWFGKGLGRYPANYFFAIPDSKFPGTYQIASEGEGAWLLLVGARHPMSFGDIFRVSQRLKFGATGPFEVTLWVRARTDVSIHAEVCEKHLLYVGGCAIGGANVKAGKGGWQSARIKLVGPVLSGSPWYAPRITMFSLGIGNQSGSADIDDIVLTGPGGESLLMNGDFGNDMQHWFFSSDHEHMPWHAKNILVNVLFDQGYVGLVLFLLLTGGALWRLNLSNARQREFAPYSSAAIIGFLAVGLFDSLIDVPRLSLMFYIFIFAAIMPNAGYARGRLAEPLPH